MSTAGPTIAGTGATRDIAANRTPWTTPENITAEDGANFATSVEDVAGTDRLRASNFGWSLGAGSTVTNVLVEAKGKVASGTANAVSSNVYDSSFNQYAYSFTSATAFTTTNTWRTMVNADPSSGFDAVAMANGDLYEFDGYAGAGTAWSIDAVRVTLTYTASTVPAFRRALLGVGVCLSALSLGLISWRPRPKQYTQTRTVGVGV